MSSTSNDQANSEIRSLNAAEIEGVAGASLKLMGEILSNVSKTRSEISMTFAQNSRA